MFRFHSHVDSATRAIANGRKPSLTFLPGAKGDSYDTSPPSRTNESYDAGIRALYGQLASSHTSEGELVRTLGVTSCHPREGKSTIAAELARVAAECQRTLLVRADDARFDLGNAKEEIVCRDLTHADPVGKEALPESGAESSVTSLRATNTHSPPNATSIQDFFQLAMGSFDLVIVDLPSVSGPGCLQWAAALDGLVLVIESERVRWQAAARSITLLEQSGGHVLGSIINKRRDYIPEFLYSRL